MAQIPRPTSRNGEVIISARNMPAWTKVCCSYFIGCPLVREDELMRVSNVAGASPVRDRKGAKLREPPTGIQLSTPRKSAWL